MRLISVLILALLGLAHPVHADEPRAERHLRVRSPHGAVHVWSPGGYDPATAATVIYVHGYFADVDSAWSGHHLAAQFRASGLNALFVACEAPGDATQPVAWTSLGELLALVRRATGALPNGRVVALGHSGAHRTLLRWLDEPRLDTIALVDAAYGDLSTYDAWLDARDDRRLIDVGDVTRAATDVFHESRPETFVIDRFPPPERGTLSLDALDARIVYVRSYMGHMALVTGGVAIPMVLRAVAAPLVEHARRDAPLAGTQDQNHPTA